METKWRGKNDDNNDDIDANNAFDMFNEEVILETLNQ